MRRYRQFKQYSVSKPKQCHLVARKTFNTCQLACNTILDSHQLVYVLNLFIHVSD